MGNAFTSQLRCTVLPCASRCVCSMRVERLCIIVFHKLFNTSWTSIASGAGLRQRLSGPGGAPSRRRHGEPAQQVHLLALVLVETAQHIVQEVQYICGRAWEGGSERG